MDIIKISLLGICGVILCFFLKETRQEYTAFITMGVGIMILGLAVGKTGIPFWNTQTTGKQPSGHAGISYNIDQDDRDHLYRTVFGRYL